MSGRKLLKLCTCALAGANVQMALDGDSYICLRCGADEQGFREAQRLVQLDWERGGTGHPSPTRIEELMKEKSVREILTDSIKRAERDLARAKTTSEKHYARVELRHAQENLTSLGPE